MHFVDIQSDLIHHTPEKSTWFSATPDDGEVSFLLLFINLKKKTQSTIHHYLNDSHRNKTYIFRHFKTFCINHF